MSAAAAADVARYACSSWQILADPAAATAAAAKGSNMRSLGRLSAVGLHMDIARARPLLQLGAHHISIQRRLCHTHSVILCLLAVHIYGHGQQQQHPQQPASAHSLMLRTLLHRWWNPPRRPGSLRQHVPWWSHVRPHQDLAQVAQEDQHQPEALRRWAGGV